MLVDPVGHEAADDPLVPPAAARGCPRTQSPRGVPVVVDVVVVEDHRRRERREQPADGGLGPRVAVEARSTPRSRRPRSPGGTLGSRRERDELRASPPGPRRRRPGRRAAAAGAASPPRPARACACASARSASCSRPRGSSSFVSVHGGSFGCATRQEPNAIRSPWSSPTVRMQLGGPAVVARPDALAVEADVVRARLLRLEARDVDQGEVMALDLERRASRQPQTSTSHGSSVSTQTVASSAPTWRSRGPRTRRGTALGSAA